MKRKQYIFWLSIFLIFIAANGINAQTLSVEENPGDSLSLDWIIQDVVLNHPAVQAAQEGLNQAAAKIGLAKSGYYPNINLIAGATSVGPVPSLDIPDIGSFSLFPRNNFTGELNVRQNVYDFGKTDRNVVLANEGKTLVEKSIEKVKQQMALTAIRTYFALDYLQEAVKIKKEQLKTLKEHLGFVQKKKETGSATEYEILSTRVRISGVETQELDLEAMRDVQLAVLNALLGLPANTFHTVKSDEKVEKPTVTGDALITDAFQKRDEMQLAKEKTGMANLHLEVVKGQNKPSLNLIANGGWKNGYIPEINKIRPNFVVGLNLNVPLFDATRTKYQLMEAQSSVETSMLETEITKRQISGEVVKNETNIAASAKKVKQANLQLEQAKEALSLAQVSYKTGAITNLDLLDAATAVSESRLMLLRSKIDYAVNVYQLKASIGERLY
ncbi:MAG TPA: TolC family protein [Draconibacterium sp.]|nr:TolC family protein [Draconibacterium sp.]